MKNPSDFHKFLQIDQVDYLADYVVDSKSLCQQFVRFFQENSVKKRVDNSVIRRTMKTFWKAKRNKFDNFSFLGGRRRRTRGGNKGQSINVVDGQWAIHFNFFTCAHRREQHTTREKEVDTQTVRFLNIQISERRRFLFCFVFRLQMTKLKRRADRGHGHALKIETCLLAPPAAVSLSQINTWFAYHLHGEMSTCFPPKKFGVWRPPKNPENVAVDEAIYFNPPPLAHLRVVDKIFLRVPSFRPF